MGSKKTATGVFIKNDRMFYAVMIVREINDASVRAKILCLMTPKSIVVTIPKKKWLRSNACFEKVVQSQRLCTSSVIYLHPLEVLHKSSAILEYYTVIGFRLNHATRVIFNNWLKGNFLLDKTLLHEMEVDSGDLKKLDKNNDESPPWNI